MPYSHLQGSVISGELTEHEEAMISKPVAVRDGDDAIILNEDEGGSFEEEEIDEGSVIVKVGEDGDGDSSQQEVEGDADDPLPEFKDDGSPTEMMEMATLLQEATQGQNDMLAKALDGGMEQAQIDAAIREFEEHGEISERAYAQLEEAGLSRAIVKSFLAGQEAVGERFANSIFNYAGGKDSFAKLANFIGTNHPDVADAFNAAVERQDVTTIKALLDSSKSLMRVTYGKPPTRSLTQKAKPVAVKSAEVPSFSSRAEMVKAMADKRYTKDAAYRKEVELKVINSKF